MTCPKCRRQQYVVCSNKRCVCHQHIPKGKKHQRNLKLDRIQCSYCQFVAHIDYWGMRELAEWEKMRGSRVQLQEQ